MTRISLIAARSANNVIGKGGKIPWSCPEDLAYFKQMTIGHTVIMGRLTYQSLGKPLPDRRNIVVSTTLTDQRVEVYRTFSDALDALEDVAEAFVIGGSKMYAEGVKHASAVHLTTINTVVPLDGAPCVFFPHLDLRDFTDSVSHKLSNIATVTTWRRRL